MPDVEALTPMSLYPREAPPGDTGPGSDAG